MVLSAASAGICEETGFRGYMQRPIEKRQGVFTAVAISSVLFMAIHLSKTWASPAMVPLFWAQACCLASSPGQRTRWFR